MGRLSIDYEALIRDLARPLAATTVGPLLLEALAERYEHEYEDCSLLQFEQSGVTYLFDFASAVGGAQEDRTVGAWTVTPATIAKRATSPTSVTSRYRPIQTALWSTAGT
jgi:hypothetical protein